MSFVFGGGGSEWRHEVHGQDCLSEIGGNTATSDDNQHSRDRCSQGRRSLPCRKPKHTVTMMV